MGVNLVIGEVVKPNVIRVTVIIIIIISSNIIKVIVSNIIKRWLNYHKNKAAIIVEHDLLMAFNLFTNIVYFSGYPGVSCIAQSPLPNKLGFNKFLETLDITIRQDINTGFSKINKLESCKDKDQKKRHKFIE